MRRIKKYSNRKLYDTEDKQYISLARVSELVRAGEEVFIQDSKTGEDLTAATMSQLLARDKGVPSGVLMQLLQKGQGTLLSARKFVSLWQGAMSMAEGELDKVVTRMVKNNELSESEGSRFKVEVMGYASNLKTWISDKIDYRVAEVLGMMNLVSREHIQDLEDQVTRLTNLVEELQNSNEPPAKDDGK
ncbi:MAG: hypothetical protein JEZ02_13520 [Desulfatibacillum sp.]|nr:hypothetical protein [Desulfatibacillum sp.]